MNSLFFKKTVLVTDVTNVCCKKLGNLKFIEQIKININVHEQVSVSFKIAELPVSSVAFLTLSRQYPKW